MICYGTKEPYTYKNLEEREKRIIAGLLLVRNAIGDHMCDVANEEWAKIKLPTNIENSLRKNTNYNEVLTERKEHKGYLDLSDFAACVLGEAQVMVDITASEIGFEAFAKDFNLSDLKDIPKITYEEWCRNMYGCEAKNMIEAEEAGLKTEKAEKIKIAFQELTETEKLAVLKFVSNL